MQIEKNKVKRFLVLRKDSSKKRLFSANIAGNDIANIIQRICHILCVASKRLREAIQNKIFEGMPNIITE